MKLAIAVRKAEPSDYGYIVHSARHETLKAFGDVSRSVEGLSSASGASALIRQHRRWLEPILAVTFDALVHGGGAVVACDANDPASLFGFAITGADRKTVVFLYVAYACRRQGVARRLLDSVEREVAA